MRPFRPQTKQYWRVVLLCFVAASTFWLLNALNKSYSTQTTYPVRFIYNSRQLVPLKPLPEEVSINVTGKGWKLLRKALRFEVKPADIYIPSLPRTNYLLGSALRPSLVNALDGLQLNFVVTDTLRFDFDEKIKRTVALQLDPKQKMVAERRAVVGPITIKPDSVTFVGPSSLVDSLPAPFLLRLPTQNLAESSQVTVPVSFGDNPLITASVEEATVSLTVKKLLQEERQLLPEVINVPAGEKMVLQPPFLLVRYQLLEDSAALLDRDAFKAVLDYNLVNKQDSTLAPELVQKPQGVRYIKLLPEKIKAIVQ
ncbi:hypothetical protein [Pontibacter liquoris]|uniref:hypothetical protein n=1 Tax=Pontibacter liquoris TaxID=2905677 RepID=UPI001FA724B5